MKGLYLRRRRAAQQKPSRFLREFLAPGLFYSFILADGREVWRRTVILTVLIPFMAASLLGWLTQLNDQMLLLINSLAGRSWFFDSIVAFFLNNDLAKAGVIGGCFLAAWYGGKTLESTNERRRILITTLIAASCVIMTTKIMSKTIFLPRPEIQTQKIFKLDGDQLVEMKRMPVRTMLDEDSQKDHRALLSGDVDSNDLGSFPSDHAGFFMAIALGIFLASRRLGLLAMGWAIFVIMAAKMISGEHTPLDIIAGASVAIIEVTIVQYVLRRGFRGWLDKLTGLTLRYSALSSAVVFIIAFEVSSTMTHVRAGLALLAAVRRHVMIGMG